MIFLWSHEYFNTTKTLEPLCYFFLVACEVFFIFLIYLFGERDVDKLSQDAGICWKCKMSQLIMQKMSWSELPDTQRDKSQAYTLQMLDWKKMFWPWTQLHRGGKTNSSVLCLLNTLFLYIYFPVPWQVLPTETATRLWATEEKDHCVTYPSAYHVFFFLII